MKLSFTQLSFPATNANRYEGFGYGSSQIISRYVKLKDYKVFDYEIPEIFLDFVIKKNTVNVTTKLKLVKKNKNTRNLILDGTDILIKNIFIDETLLERNTTNSKKIT